MGNENTAEFQKMILSSQDIRDEQIAKLKLLFPEVFTEGQQIDFEKLRLSLGEHIEIGKERYGLNWPGKADCFKTIQTASIGTLRPCQDSSVNFSDTENLFIEGDNLEVLKLLQKSYSHKVKMIYIDPPYNSGNDFVYPDDFSESLETYLSYTGQSDEKGRKFSTNAETSGRFHSNWLNMMYPRIFLARNLLRDDGLIFVSIDDTEVANLRKILDEIFGENCFVCQVIWEKRITRENRRYFSFRHDYILIYAKNPNRIAEVVGLLPMNDEARSRYKNPDNDPRGEWTSVPAIAQAGHATKSQFYKLVTPNGRQLDPPSGSCWRYTEDKMKEAIADNRIWFGSDGNGVPRIKKFLNEGRQGLTPETIWWAKEVETNDVAKRELVQLFDGHAVFDTPKPVALISRMLELCVGANDIVLDFFAGSCPTAEAVIRWNCKHSSSVKFICIQLPEQCSEDSIAFKQGFKSIAEIGRARIERVIKSLLDGPEDRQGSLDIFSQTRDSLQKVLGFRYFRLAKSNFRIWEAKTDEQEIDGLKRQLELHTNHLETGATHADILFEILLKSGFSLTEKIVELKHIGEKTYSIADGALIICLEDHITKDIVSAIAEYASLRVVFLDSGFKQQDALKKNALLTLQAKNHEVVVKSV